MTISVRLASVLLVAALALPAGLVLAAPAPAPAAVPAAAPQADGPNLLQNPGFEGPFFKQCWKEGRVIYGVLVGRDEQRHS